ncbi:RNA-binding transcriptional accessory protein [Cohaesibacter sp. CAU 1516]|uniref:Tex family protein n=1 Tax=Cohaesibacter sp. CAU 1516 TaxID=2576038 RepID=UPI0010FCE757|nr:Tex family protein [Cohaesibacter sp. CAU 1516]TLP44340.1 RNA-binding transcriptional accessory protein [Cohaesibacter sp. CAU 1516]
MMNLIEEMSIPKLIAAEIGCQVKQVIAAVELIDNGDTIPFIARYRKEVTGGLDDVQLRKLDERLLYLRDFSKRREAVKSAIEAQGKLTDDILTRLGKATTKAELEDIHAPYRVKLKTKAQKAIDNGLQPLAEAILAQPQSDPEALASPYLGETVPSVKAALDGVRDILSEQFSHHPDTAAKIRPVAKKSARLRATVVAGKEEAGNKFADYFDHTENWAKAPGHRILAMLRGQEAEMLFVDVEFDDETVTFAKSAILNDNEVPRGSVFLDKVIDWTWKVKFTTRLISEMRSEMRERAEKEAIDVFVTNLKALLMAAPAGMKATMGLDPGIRTGVKVAVVDATGKLLATSTVYPYAPRNDVRGTLAELGALVRKFDVELIAIGNGTASRETDALVGELLKEMNGKKPRKVVVSEAGASVYSASEFASREFPDLDVSLRGAVSIARRLQDPLAELVKIDPKAIGVGQYQHDVDQSRLARALAGAVEDVVNSVGVDVNTASPALLSYVAGVGPSLAEMIVSYRDENGIFTKRSELKSVPRLGPRAFSQCAGFLRVIGGPEPLDSSAVHPEAYKVAKQIVADCGRDLRDIMGDASSLRDVDPEKFVTGEFGIPTIKDIIEELRKPGRDPRPEFKTASFMEGINEISDLRPGMRLEGTVTNVAAFGAFVDIGVHQDGLVHISQLSDSYVSDPSKVVKAGQVVKVVVTSVDVKAKRIGLSMKSNPEIGEPVRGKKPAPRQRDNKPAKTQSKSDGMGQLGEALAKAFRK